MKLLIFFMASCLYNFRPMHASNLNENLIRSEFKALSEVTYLNSAFMGPLPLRAQTAISEATQRLSNPAFYGYEWMELPNMARAQLANLLASNPERISHHTSVSQVISLIAQSFPLTEKDEVALVEEEYPSGVLPWLLAQKNKKFKVQFIKKDSLKNLDLFFNEINKETKILCVSQVFFQTGLRVDLEDLGKRAKDKGLFLIVDGTQAFGGLALSKEELNKVDVYTASTYKWLLGPYGHAFAHWSDRALETVERSEASWLAMPQVPKNLTQYTLETLSGANKYDRGQAPNIIGLKGLIGSLSLLKELGLERIEEHNQSLTNHFKAQLKSKSLKKVDGHSDSDKKTPKLESNIICLSQTGSSTADNTKLIEILRSKSIDVSLREGHIRFSFHLFNTKKDIDKVLEVLNPS